jgi:hypothetical protein
MISSLMTRFLTFRHALLRDAAYHLRLPGERARLHAGALASVEGLCGGRQPPPFPIEDADEGTFRPHATDPFAEDLADHARIAGLAEKHSACFRRVAELVERDFRPVRAAELRTGVPPVATEAP